MTYNIDFQALALWIGVAAVVVGVYLFLSLDSSPVQDESTLSLDIQQDKVRPGDTVRITASNSTGPVEDVEINANGENIGNTNENGIAGYSVPENAEELNISGEHQGTTATLEASIEDGVFSVDDGSDSDDSTDSGGSQDGDEDSEPENDGSDSTNQDDDTANDSGDQTGGNGNNNQGSEQDDQTDDSEQGETGLALENDPVANELNTVTLTKNGDPVEASVYVNNAEIGTTSSTGALVFTVPNTQEITVSTDADIESGTFTVEGYTNKTGDDTTDQEPEVLDAYYQYTPESPSIGDEIEFDASQTTGNNIQSYEWDFGEGSTGTGQTATNTYGSAGTYTAELTVTDEEGNTDSIDADVTVEDQAEPDLLLRKPDDGSEHTETELQYNLTLYNGLEGSEYRILTNGNTAHTGQIGKDGTTELTPIVTVPDGEFTTTAEIDQGAETYTSETKTITAGQTAQEPSFVLNFPSDGQTFESFNDQMEIDFEYTVEEKGWADESTVEIVETGDSYTRTVSSGETYGSNFDPELEASNEGSTYDYRVTLFNSDGQETSKTKSFNVVKSQPTYMATLGGPKGTESDPQQINYYEGVTLTTDVESETNSQLKIIVEANEDGENTFETEEGEQTVSYSEGDTVSEDTLSVREGVDTTKQISTTFNVAMQYRWKAQIIADSSVQTETDYQYFETTEEPGSGGSGDEG